MKDCLVCGEEVLTLGDNPLCSKEHRIEWVQSEVNTMSDEEAYCPLCKEEKHVVRTVVKHVNDVHNMDINRTKTCQWCDDEFVPTNWQNPNKYCCPEHYGLDNRTKGVGQFECQNCGTIDDYSIALYDALGATPRYCSNECQMDGEHHPLWKGDAIVREIRKTPEYRQWKKGVHESSKTCQYCGESKDEYHAHHVEGISENRDLAYDESNGVRLCVACHALEHQDDPQVFQLLKSRTDGISDDERYAYVEGKSTFFEA